MELEIALKARTLLKLLVGVSLGFVLVSLVYVTIDNAADFGYRGSPSIRRWLNADNDLSVAAWFSVVQLLLATVLVATVATRAWSQDKANRKPWLVLAFIFLGLSLDEFVGFHSEAEVNDLVEPIFGTGGFFKFVWVVPAALLVGVFCIAYVPFLRRIDTRIRNGLIVAGALYVFGALVLEAISGKFAESQGFSSAAYVIVAHLEEVFELVGISLFATVILVQARMFAPSSAYNEATPAVERDSQKGAKVDLRDDMN